MRCSTKVLIFLISSVFLTGCMSSRLTDYQYAQLPLNKAVAIQVDNKGNRLSNPAYGYCASKSTIEAARYCALTNCRNYSGNRGICIVGMENNNDVFNQSVNELREPKPKKIPQSNNIEKRGTLFDHSYKDFAKLQKHAAVKTWSTCAATFQLLEEPPQDPQLRNVFTTRKNGASMTVSMIYVMETINAHGGYVNKKPKAHPEMIRSLKISKSTGDMVMESQPKVILSDLRVKALKGSSAFYKQLQNTVELCAENGDVADTYINHWRELRANGWFDK